VARPSTTQLGARERQIMDAIHQLGEGSVSDVRQRLADAPTYSTVRTMLRMLEKKGYLKHRRDGIKYVYRPTQAPEEALRSALTHLLKTFFAGSAGDAIATIHLASRGIPRIINLICEHALILAYVEQIERIPAPLIQAVARDLDLNPQAFMVSATQGGTPTDPTLPSATHPGGEKR